MNSIIENLGIDWKLFLAQIINFAIVFFVLKRFVFKPIQEVLEKREKSIKKGLDEAKEAESNLLMAESKYKEKLEEARLEGNKVIAKAQASHDQIVAKAQTDAKLESDKIMESTKLRVHDEEKKMVSRVKKNVIDLTFLTTEKLLNKEVDNKTNQEFIENIINER
ncbi:MAG: F0F1 ATP synthase subunit B [Patescibacteria group bacterium]|nr:F0F1 ATP synthase subunit B [Patescibacteria group bacterium]